MSSDALAHVFRCSPYRGTSAAHAVLVAIADTVSDVHGYRFWMAKDELADKARVSARNVGPALRQLEADGWIRREREATNRSPAVFRMVVDRAAPVVWEPRAARGDAASPQDARPREEPSEPARNVQEPAAGGGDAPSPQPETARGDAASPRGGCSVTSRGDAASPEPKRTQSNPTTPSATPAGVAGQEHPPDDPPDGEVDVDAERFEQHFWPVYPARNGRKVAKGRALVQWRKLNLDEQRRAVIGARHLAASGTLPKDAHRFLRRDTAGAFPFDDWQTPGDDGAGVVDLSERRVASARSRGRSLAAGIDDRAEALELIAREFGDEDPDLNAAAIDAYDAARQEAAADG